MKRIALSLFLISSFSITVHAITELAAIGTERTYCEDKEKAYSTQEECENKCGGACTYNPKTFQY